MVKSVGGWVDNEMNWTLSLDFILAQGTKHIHP